METNGTKKGGDNPKTLILSTGVKLNVTPVPDFLMNQAGRHLPVPKAPYILDPRYDDGRKFFNEDDPEYIQTARQYNVDLGMARIDTKLLWGCEIVEGYPDDDTWLKKLKFQEDLGAIDLSEYNLDEDFVKRFVYLKLFAIGNELDPEDGSNTDLNNIINALEVSDQGVDNAIATFPSNQEGDSDTPSTTKEPS